MNNKYIFLRHAETIKDPDIDAKDWKLTAEALDKINEYNDIGVFDGVEVIVTSMENKAITTALPVSKKYNLNIINMEEFNEIGRSNKFLTNEEFLVQKKRQLTELDAEVDGGESGRSALSRFKSGIF